MPLLQYKENISPLKDDFSKILAAQPVTFVWKKSKESDVGLIAEEMDELGLQNLVIYNTEGKPESVRYKLLSLYLIEILKDQDDSIKNIQTENESLKERLGSQEKTLKQLQSIIMKGEVR